MQFSRREWLTIAAFAVVYLVWGSTYLAIRIGLETMPPMLMAGVRFLIAGTILCSWALARGAKWPTRGQWLRSALAGFLMLVLGNGGVTWAEQYVPSGIAALLVASEPFSLVLLSWGFFGGRRPGLRTTAGLMIGLLGVALLIMPEVGDAKTGGLMLAGSIAIILAAVAWAAGSLYLRKADLPESSTLSTGMQMLIAGAMLGSFGLSRGEGNAFDPAKFSTHSLLAFGYLICFGSILAFSAYSWLITATTPARLSTYAYVNPVIAVLLGSVVAHEPIAPLAWVAMFVIVASVALVTTGEVEDLQEGHEDEVVVLPGTLGEQT
ncbi:drug/metabolite exporter YedA [Singulisphaera sp. PoT]|uniref:drug/metabolite exporter YedA n=1 Tax=Singulisphaera sp. PoT TaxID=3411797 RepID=UPI003BF49469